MLLVLTILSLTSYFLSIRRGGSAQNLFLVSLIYSYQLILLASIYFAIPLDIFSDSDDPKFRFELAWMNLLFFSSIYTGQYFEPKFSKHFINHNEIESWVVVKLLFFVLIVIVTAQVFVMPPRIFSGEYSNEKPGYYFEYFTIFFCLYFAKARPQGAWSFAPFMAFCLISVLAGERLMLITAISGYIYFQRPFKINIKTLILLGAGLFAVLQLDSLRSGSERGGLIGSFIFDEDVTHHGSLLYSSLVLLEYANNNAFSLHSLANSFSFLLGLDDSTQGLGLAAEIASFGRRGGGGLLPSYLSVLFGGFFGPLVTVTVGLFIGILIQAHSQGKKLGFLSLVFLSFTAHFVIYTPVLILKPLFLAWILALAWGLATEFFHTGSRKRSSN